MKIPQTVSMFDMSTTVTDFLSIKAIETPDYLNHQHCIPSDDF